MKLSNQKNNQIYKEICSLATHCRGFYKLDEFDRSIAINNAFMMLTSKMEIGRVPIDKYEDYKGYMFITIRNSIYRMFVYKKTQKSQTDNQHMEDTYYKEPHVKNVDLYDYNRIKTALDKLSPFEKALIRWYGRNWSYEYIANQIGMPKSSLINLFARLRSNLKKALDDKTPIRKFNNRTSGVYYQPREGVYSVQVRVDGVTKTIGRSRSHQEAVEILNDYKASLETKTSSDS